MEIRKVKLVTDKINKDQKCLTVGYKHPTKNKKNAEYVVDYHDFAHEDLVKAFKGLIPHYALIIEAVKEDEIDDIKNYDDSLFEHFRVTSFAIAGKDEDLGITITGYKVLSSGKAMIMNAPFLKFSQPDDGYGFMPQFESALETLKSEVQQYIDGNKYAPDPQLGMFDDKGSPITTAKIAAPLTEEEKVIEKLGRENIPKLPAADPEAMGRVAAMANTPGPKEKGKGGKKKPQTSDNRKGE